MAKYLTLIRHAKSSWGDATLRDFDRPLNARGQRDAPRIAKHLVEQQIRPDALIASSAVRTRHTAAPLLETFIASWKMVEFRDSLYEASFEDVYAQILRLSDELNDVIVVGHNPTMSETAMMLGRNFADAMATAATVRFQFSAEHWEEIAMQQGELLFYFTPKNA